MATVSHLGILDDFAHPRADSRTLAERREMLRDQLAWLMDEAAALSPLLRELPDWALAESALAGEERATVLRRLRPLQPSAFPVDTKVYSYDTRPAVLLVRYRGLAVATATSDG